MVRQNIASTKPIPSATPKPSGDNILQSIIGYIKGLMNDVKGIKEQDLPYMYEHISIMESNVQKLAESVNAQRYYIEQMHRYHLSLKQIAASLDAMSTEYLNLTMPAQAQPDGYPDGYNEGVPAEETPEEEPDQEPMTLDELEAQVAGLSAEPEPIRPEPEPIRPIPHPARHVVAPAEAPEEAPPEVKPKKEPKLKARSAADIIKNLEASIENE